MGNITIQGDLTGGVPGGEVGGASNLTTVGAIPYVSASGVLNQDPTALFWDSANNSLGIRTNSPNPAYAATIGGTVSLDSIDQRVNLPFRISTLYDTAIQFFVNSAEAARFAATTRNLLIGTTTDLGYGLHAANRATNGNFLCYDPTSTTGTTKCVFRAGAGQGTNNIAEFQNSSGSVIGFISSAGAFNTNGGSIGVRDAVTPTRTDILLTPGFAVLASGSLLAFASTNDATGTKDTSLSRASAGVLQVGDGGSNANGTVKAAGAVFSTTANATPVVFKLSATGTGSDSAVDLFGCGAYINLRSTLAGPYAGTQINKSSNTVLWFTGTQGSDVYSWFTGSSLTSLASLTTGGTFSIYNQTATTGVTKAVIRAGAGQGTTNLTEWQNSAGTAVAFINDSGTFANGGQTGAILNQTQVVQLGSDRLLVWGSTASYGSTKDLGLARNAAGVLEIDSGTAGAYRDLILRRLQMGGQTVSQLPAAAAGNAGSTQYVTDATATTISSIVTGGGSNKVLVWSDGTNWKIMAS